MTNGRLCAQARAYDKYTPRVQTQRNDSDRGETYGNMESNSSRRRTGGMGDPLAWLDIMLGRARRVVQAGRL